MWRTPDGLGIHITGGAPSFLDTCLVQLLLPDFEVNERQHAVVRVHALRVVEQLSPIARIKMPASYAV